LGGGALWPKGEGGGRVLTKKIGEKIEKRGTSVVGFPSGKEPWLGEVLKVKKGAEKGVGRNSRSRKKYCLLYRSRKRKKGKGTCQKEGPGRGFLDGWFSVEARTIIWGGGVLGWKTKKTRVWKKAVVGRDNGRTKFTKKVKSHNGAIRR